ncbi:hypothetical protein CDD83_6647 [Cordyceps sp. RAO-2017]|nr:hypothetical protein CDD83_6647 [Cordyceps sp. RAO-2017]
MYLSTCGAAVATGTKKMHLANTTDRSRMALHHASRNGAADAADTARRPCVPSPSRPEPSTRQNRPCSLPDSLAAPREAGPCLVCGMLGEHASSARRDAAPGRRRALRGVPS